MELGRGYTTNQGSEMKKHLHFHGGAIVLNPDTVLVIRVPDAQILRIMSRFLFMAMVLAALPFLGTILRGFSSISQSSVSEFGSASGFENMEQLNLILHETKKDALKGLEDVLLEPPTQRIIKSRKYLKKIKYLPELLGDSLEGYNRRLFISAGLLSKENKGVIEWFERNYPKKDTKFEIHSLLFAPGDDNDVSAWLSRHVKEEEYVVMKAEAEVVEEMIKERTIYLVDELFLECKNEWWQKKGKRKKSRRAYWECLALYGRLRDEGVAVHQWWG